MCTYKEHVAEKGEDMLSTQFTPVASRLIQQRNWNDLSFAFPS